MQQHSSLGLRALEAVGKETYARQLALRRRILAVAKHRLARFSYEGVTCLDIARGADVSERELLLHFDDQAALLRAVLDEVWDAVCPRLADIVSDSVTARDAALGLLALMMNLLERDEDGARLLLAEGRRPDGDGELQLSAGYRRFMHLCTAIVTRGQQDGSFKRSLQPKVVASMLVGAIEGIMRDRLIARQDSSITPYTGAYLFSAFDTLIAALRA